MQGIQGVQGIPGGFGAYGSFYDTSTTTLVTNIATVIPLNTVDFSSGVSVIDNYKISMSQSGKYNIAFSTQLRNRSNGTRIVTIWLSRNGVAPANWIPESATDIYIGRDTDTERIVAAWNFFVNASSSDYFALMIVANGDSVDAYGGTSANLLPAGIPQIPSTILTVNQVG